MLHTTFWRIEQCESKVVPICSKVLTLVSCRLGSSISIEESWIICWNITRVDGKTASSILIINTEHWMSQKFYISLNPGHNSEKFKGNWGVQCVLQVTFTITLLGCGFICTYSYYKSTWSVLTLSNKSKSWKYLILCIIEDTKCLIIQQLLY